MLYPKEFDYFSDLVTTYVELHLLLKIIPFDMQLMVQSGLKLSRAYYDVLKRDCERIVANYMKGERILNQLEKEDRI